MIDYLFQFNDEATAKTALKAQGYCMEDQWDASRCLTVSVIVGQTKVGVDLVTGLDITIPIPAAGFWLVISTPAVDDKLYAIPACMREADRELALQDKPYVLRERFTSVQLKVAWQITPQWCGVDYSNNPG